MLVNIAQHVVATQPDIFLGRNPTKCTFTVTLQSSDSAVVTGDYRLWLRLVRWLTLVFK